MQNVPINESIDVGAVFTRTNIKPKWFVWKGKKHTVTQITYSWKDTLGEARLIHFSVTDGATLFELSLNQKTMSWTLEAVTVE
jgi:hypothetical protein